MIRETDPDDLARLLAVHNDAFGVEEGPIIVDLVTNLIQDSTAQPLLSLLALENDKAVGHILFTRAIVGDTEAMLLAPLAVIPDAQKEGVGGQLIADGLERLKSTDCGLVFVLGYPAYYNRHGFETAAAHALHAPYPIPPEHVDAWMVQAVKPGILGDVTGTLECADAISKQEYWVE